MSISVHDRFTVLRRDGFGCQYCGRKAREVVLEVDHIVPQSQGGRDNYGNLITACRDCNRGKQAMLLLPVLPGYAPAFCGECECGWWLSEAQHVERDWALMCPPCWEKLAEETRVLHGLPNG